MTLSWLLMGYLNHAWSVLVHYCIAVDHLSDLLTWFSQIFVYCHPIINKLIATSSYKVFHLGHIHFTLLYFLSGDKQKMCGFVKCWRNERRGEGGGIYEEFMLTGGSREGWLFTFGTLRRGRTEMGDECMLRGGFVGGIFTFGTLRRERTEMGDGGRDWIYELVLRGGIVGGSWTVSHRFPWLASAPHHTLPFSRRG